MAFSRFGGRVRTNFTQVETATAIGAATTLADRTLDVSDAEYIVFLVKFDYTPNAAVVTDMLPVVVPATQDSVFWTGGAPLPTVYAISKAVSGNVGYFAAQYDVRALQTVTLRYQNSAAANAAVINAFIAKSLRETNH